MRNNYLIIIILLSTSVFANPGDSILEGYIQQARSENYSLKAAVTRVEAFDEMIPQAGALPDPILGIGVANLPVNSFEFDLNP